MPESAPDNAKNPGTNTTYTANAEGVYENPATAVKVRKIK
jgi:hypothetical protein